MLLQIENLTFGWHKKQGPLFENINCHLANNEIIQLAGENGSGKTTLLKLIAGMIPHFSRGEILTGEVFIKGRSIKKAAPKNFFPAIAFIPSLNLDFFLLTESLTQEMLLTSSILKINEDQVKQRLNEFGNFFPDLSDFMNLPLKQQQFWQKVLSLTFIYYLQNAQLYLFDEVFTMFAESLIPQWYSFFKWLSSKGSAIIFVDHQRQGKRFSQWLLKDRGLVRG
jgi:energy-coupling factor transporter ATP-binding protein EcfA2